MERVTSAAQLPTLVDVVIAGGGIIGLSLALAVRESGASVAVLERSHALGGASTAAAGMLAVDDPHNPPALLPLSRYSRSLYCAFLTKLQHLSGQSVPFQTNTTVQYIAHGPTMRLAEQSLDPRQLATALLAAARAASVHVMEHTAATQIKAVASGIHIETAAGEHVTAGNLVHTTGAWVQHPALSSARIVPRKGQMLRVTMPPDAQLAEVHRAEHVYVAPRTAGPQVGSALIGATVEDAGFDLSTSPADLQTLRELAAALGPATAFAADAPQVEAWAGLRPATRDQLPLIGQIGECEWIAAGHFRNGILLAPGTANLLAGMLRGESPAVDLTPFRPFR